MPPPFRVIRTYIRLPPQPGGMETHIAELSKAQRALGVEVINVHNTGEATEASLRVFPGHDLTRLRPAALRNALFYAAIGHCSKILRSKVPTIVHAHGDWSDFVFAKGLARAIGAQAVAGTMHCVATSVWTGRYRLALKDVDLAFATGMADRLFLQKLLNRSIHHMPSAPRAIFFSEAPAPSPEWDVISVANFFAVKNPFLILDCAKARPNLRFVVFGDGPLWAEARKRVTEGRLTNVTLEGQQPPNAIANALAKARVFLSTSQKEGTPTACLEAMAKGLPVLLTPSNDYGWLIKNGENGFVTEGFTVSELTARMDDLLADEPRRHAMGAANKQRAQALSWQAHAERASALMAEALGVPWPA